MTSIKLNLNCFGIKSIELMSNGIIETIYMHEFDSINEFKILILKHLKLLEQKKKEQQRKEQFFNDQIPIWSEHDNTN